MCRRRALNSHSRVAKPIRFADSARSSARQLRLQNIPRSSFDAIWIDDILHHLIPELSAVLARVLEWCKPGARVVLAEPISYSPFLRRIRGRIPIHTDVTPDERPLEHVEIDTIRKHLPNLTVRYF